MRGRVIGKCAGLILAVLAGVLSPISFAQSIDLAAATILLPPDADGPQKAAAQLLSDEIAKRTGRTWAIIANPVELLSNRCKPCIVLGHDSQLHGLVDKLGVEPWPAIAQKPETFRIDTLASEHGLVIEGQDDRGVLFGVGYLLRHLEMADGRAVLTKPLHVVSSPQLTIRGHQLGYRSKNNTYDAWTPEQFEQYIRDLAVFGTNTIELLPPITDDAPSSPLFHLPPLEMMKRVSGIVKKYGLRCSVYFPAIAKDYSNPATVQSELRTWEEVFRSLPQVDEVFVPGGDPGQTDPTVLFPFLEKVAAVLHASHPEASVWVSAQGFNAERMEQFYRLVNARPAWLTGVVVGPQSRDDLKVQRGRISPELPIRFYPDIGHTMHSQFPLASWDVAFALTEGREVINPRPHAEATIFRHYAPYMSGFVTYSEGVNDDVNKFIWTSLGWSKETSAEEIVREYAQYFVGSSGFHADQFAEGLLNLEANWDGPLVPHEAVDTTLKNMQQIESAATPTQKSNWRFEEALYRAYTDAYERHRLIAANGSQQKALEALSNADQMESLKAMESAEAALSPDRAAAEQLRPWREKIEELAARLYRHVGLQLSVQKFGASAVDRGASLDTLDVELNDRAWLQKQFSRIRSIQDEGKRLDELNKIAHWADAGPGGFYDDLGDATAEPHLIRGAGYSDDPALFESAHDGIADRTPDQGWKLSEISYAGALYDYPLELKYAGLDRAARYKVRVTYAGEDYALPITLTANESHVVHGPRVRGSNPETAEFPIPIEATRTGTLDLRWTRPKGVGGGGRGFQIAEVWLIRDSR